ncbi:unnamed protein product [Absidia cylindrospora]
MYEYDDDRYNHISLDKLISNRSNPNIIHVPADVDDEPDGGLSLLAQALLGDYFDPNSSTNDFSKPPSSPGATKQGDSQSSSSSSSSSPLSSKSSLAPSTTTTIPKLNNDYATVDQLGIQHSPVMEKRQPTSNSEMKTMDNTSRSSLLEQTAPTTTTTSRPPGTLFATEEHLIETAVQLMDLFTLKERCRLNDYSDHLRHKPNDTKGILMNMARKLDDGYYETAVEHVQLGKASERAHYIATVRFGTPDLELSLARGHTKKSTAEGLAAMAIFSLIDKASKTINNQMNLPFL